MQDAPGRRDRYPMAAPSRRLVGVVAAAALLGACGEVSDGDGVVAPSADHEDPPSAAGAAAGIAPRCQDVAPLEAQRPEGVEPLGTTGAPLDDTTTGGPTVETLAPAVQRWAREHAGDDFAGLWFDQDAGGLVVAFTGDVEAYAAGVRDAVHPAVAVADATFGEAELQARQERIWSQENPSGEPVPGLLTSSGLDVMRNRVALGLYDPPPERLEQLSDDHGADAICFEIQEPPPPPSRAATTLAKLDGWGQGPPSEPRWGFLEIAWDEDAAAELWDLHVGDRTPDTDDDPPATGGVYGELDQVASERQALAVYFGGESGSCPAYVISVTTVDAGYVAVDEGAVGAGACTDDFNPYRVVLAVDRDRLPDADDLPLRVPHDDDPRDGRPADVATFSSD
ncbi:hypothetical protein [Egicoccus sp. AB-alg6-2]|uniref:hypothetical protein n=1 Tax=Egicoccus sp. AB-alg6-2 TaxID=3242692 RepID=UPI00359DB3E1